MTEQIDAVRFHVHLKLDTQVVESIYLIARANGISPAKFVEKLVKAQVAKHADRLRQISALLRELDGDDD